MSLKDYLPSRPTETLSKIEVFKRHFDDIYSFRKELYSYHDLRMAFQKKTGVSLTYETFRDYFNICRRDKGYASVNIRTKKEDNDYVEID